MKIIFYLFAASCLLLAAITATVGQTPPIQFTYDAAGNRILRYVENPEQAPELTNEEMQNETDYTPQDTIPPTFRVTVYPNPVITNLQVSIEVLDNSIHLPTTFNISLVSMQGTVIYQQSHSAQSPVFVNMYSCQPGYYLLIVVRGTEIHQLTIIKT